MISIEDFKKVEIKVGEILSAEKIENTNKLLKLSVDLGEATTRQIISGIAEYFPDPSYIVGKKCMFVSNLEPRKIMGYESDGMLFALSSQDGRFSFVVPEEDLPAGTKAI